MILDIPDVDPKSLREMLCVAQSRIGNSNEDPGRKAGFINMLSNIIVLIDNQRPLGPDGKHGDRHTPYCGCEGTLFENAHFHLGASSLISFACKRESCKLPRM